jgi:hypothetical protein
MREAAMKPRHNRRDTMLRLIFESRLVGFGREPQEESQALAPWGRASRTTEGMATPAAWNTLPLAPLSGGRRMGKRFHHVRSSSYARRIPRRELADGKWKGIEPLLPPKRPVGRPPGDDRKAGRGNPARPADRVPVARYAPGVRDRLAELRRSGFCGGAPGSGWPGGGGPPGSAAGQRAP